MEAEGQKYALIKLRVRRASSGIFAWKYPQNGEFESLVFLSLSAFTHLSPRLSAFIGVGLRLLHCCVVKLRF